MNEVNLESSKSIVDLCKPDMHKEVTRILHVDADRAFLEVAKECLETHGSFHVDTASSVEEAFGKLKKEQFDVVISDYMMPGKDGLEFLKELRQSGNTIPFVLFTGKGGEEVAINALNLGANGYFNKSGALQAVYTELTQSLRQIVEKRRETDAARKTLEDKLRVAGSLTRHDVRNKLSVVTCNTFLLRRWIPGDPKVLRQLEDIDAAVLEVERIFEFARFYEKLGIEELVYVDAKQVLGEATSLFSDLKGIEILNECGRVIVLADSQLKEVFYNLIDNSLKYGEKTKTIRVRYENALDRLKLIYEDDGVGISEEMRSSLSKEDGGKGTGHGFFMIKKLCEVYGWMIEETGKQGEGVQFIITIPRNNSSGKTLYKIEE